MRAMHLSWLACVLACAATGVESTDDEVMAPRACAASEDLPADVPAFIDDATIAYESRDDGLATHDRRVGDGEIVAGEVVVEMTYTAYFMDGCPFDSTIGRGPMKLPLHGVIPGMRDGLQGMRVGGARRIFIPAHLAYGDQGAGPVPGGADLVFEVELLGVESPEAFRKRG